MKKNDDAVTEYFQFLLTTMGHTLSIYRTTLTGQLQNLPSKEKGHIDLGPPKTPKDAEALRNIVPLIGSMYMTNRIDGMLHELHNQAGEVDFVVPPSFGLKSEEAMFLQILMTSYSSEESFRLNFDGYVRVGSEMSFVERYDFFGETIADIAGLLIKDSTRAPLQDLAPAGSC